MRKDKHIAIKLRQSGLSYAQISKKLAIPKSTLSGWLKNIKELQLVTNNNIRNAKKVWAKNITQYNKKRSLQARQNWLVMQNKTELEIGSISERELKLIGTALYWAEGYKRGNWNIIFCNSEPAMIKIMMRFFIKICNVPKEKIRCQIQIHHNISSTTARKYWMKITNVSADKFLKPIYQQSKSSKLKRKNNLPYGTLRIRVNDVKLVNKIKGWITGLPGGLL